MTVDDQTRTYIGRGVDVGLQRGMRGNVARRMMIEIAHASTGIEHSGESVCVTLHRNVQHRELVAGAGLDAFEQPDFAFDAGHEFGRARRRESKLVQRAEPVRIAVENIVGFGRQH